MIAVYSARVALPDLLRMLRSLTRVPKPATTAPTAAATAGPCSKAEATRVVKRLHLGNADDPDVSDPVAEVLCGAFVGPGRQAMVASLAIPSCGRTAGWVVFRRAGATWELVMERHNGADLDAVGTGIRETQFVLRPGDAHCFPTGGTRSRTWRWNGARFTSTAWTQSKPPTTPQTPSVTLPSGYLKTPSGNIACVYWLRDGAAEHRVSHQERARSRAANRPARVPSDRRREPPSDRSADHRRPVDLSRRGRGRRRPPRLRVRGTGACVRHDLGRRAVFAARRPRPG